MRRLLCQRPPIPELPAEILEDIDAVITHRNKKAVLTSSTSITPSIVLTPNNHMTPEQSSSKGISISLWKGDITSLADVTAIVNAANSQLLGCFRPDHRCIDNVIHSAAGPRLRDACNSLMLKQGHPEPVGSVKVTPGFNLPAPWVLHTVGPQVNSRKSPGAVQKQQLAGCYRSCLDATESLPALPDGRKVVAFCCISTGLFAFPPDMAAKIALETVVQWCLDHPATTVTDIIFDTFMERDYELYQANISELKTNFASPGVQISFPPSPSHQPKALITPTITKARGWLKEADYLVISAGAGLSAAIGLDYTSTSLFEKHFPAFLYLGLGRLYDVFGFNDWDSPNQKWGYYFLHLNMVRAWPASKLYGALRKLAAPFADRYFVRTSNADGQFAANGFPAEKVSTPQGQYRFLQCFAKCRPDAVFPSDPFVDAALPFIDPKTQVLTDEPKIPACQYCGGELTLCVRGGDYFNSAPFRTQEHKWKQYIEDVASNLDGRRAVILELGVGLNTPAVLRWPNEELVEDSLNPGFRLIRAGIGASGCAPWDLEERDLAVGIEGDLGLVVEALVG
ncbi:ganglioside induced differentiation associated protein [Aspergillus bombycis]|uniref:Ganglioside induced differentiation associated protein n=1 Tax=Aspergillus bombycis TaxID=109264 RepID=A0A1F7ZME3_9EURO|nr:ganglioside induced differentiation associated protein [Aspergillus bombycis]OGM40636.1 ganglioside induced differentiation associated protein [Aspergillus bombycis]